MIRSARLARLAFSSNKTPVAPKAPKLLGGQLQSFRFEVENAQIYDGFTLDQLYGKKYGVKHPPAVRAQMTKDSIAAILVLGIGASIIYHLDSVFREEHKAIKNAVESKLNRDLEYAQ